MRNTTGLTIRILTVCAFVVAGPLSSGDSEYFGRRLEPRRHCILHGAGQSPDAFAEYFEAVGPTKPMIYMTYVALKADQRGYFERLQRELGKYPVFLVPQIGLGMTRGGKPELHYEHEVAEGKWDANIDAFCKGLRQLGRPAFVRIGYEFNGQWNGYRPETYRKAWIRIVKAFRRHGLEDVAAAWCYAPGSKDKQYMKYYPGDEHVDWWSIDLFSPGLLTANNTVAFMNDAQSHGFPVIVGESTPRRVGVLKGEESWRKWYAIYFDFMRRFPHTKAFCYINWEWARYPRWKNWGDARIQANEVVLEKWRKQMSREVYFHGASEDETRRLLGPR